MSNNDMLINRLSLSKIGDLLKDSLGEQAEDYVFPEDFEKAIVDIGFSGLVMTGDEAPYDLIVIGDGLAKAQKVTRTDNAKTLYKTATLIGTSSLPSSAFRWQTSLQSISGLENITSLNGDSAFLGCACREINMPNLVAQLDQSIFQGASVESASFGTGTTFGTINAGNSGQFYGCSALKNVVLLGATTIPSDTNTRGAFINCSSLETVQLGSVGYAVTSIGSYAFTGCSQVGLTVTVYAKDSYIDTAISKIRNGATNATIVVKAPTDLVYGGVTYSAGDTVVTSTP